MSVNRKENKLTVRRKKAKILFLNRTSHIDAIEISFL